MQILAGHTSPETAYIVDDYPYGFRLRCKIRYWLEYHPARGFRFVSQTTNPKRGNVWNKPKASTYSKFGGCMYLNDEGHVTWAGLTEYCNAKEAENFQTVFGAGVPEAGRETLRKWVAAKVAYEANRSQSDPLHVGLAEARKAFVEAGATLSREKALDIVYANTPRDYRGTAADRQSRTILVLREGGTCLVQLSDLTDAEIARKLPSEYRSQWGSRG